MSLPPPLEDPRALARAAAEQPRLRPLVMLSWDGHSAPLPLLHVDAVPQFDLVVFDYSGRAPALPALPGGLSATLMSQATECKGELFRALHHHLLQQPGVPEFVGLVDDDVLLSVADINRLLHYARCLDLHCFAPALSHDSLASHRFTLRSSQRISRAVDWVEVMMPFYAGPLYMATGPAMQALQTVSSWGLDAFVFPVVQQITGLDRTAIVDAVVATHTRPVSSNVKTFRNGRTSQQEAELARQLAQQLLQQHRPDLQGSAWAQRILVQRSRRRGWRKLSDGIGRRIRRWLERST